MFTETLVNKKRGGWAAFFSVIGLVLGMILLVSVTGALGAVTGLRAFEYAGFAAAAAAAYLLIKRWLTDYRYTLGADQVLFERVVGTRARVLCRVPFAEITALAGEPAAGGAAVLRATFLRKGADVLLYTHRNKAFGVVFHPTDAFLGRLRAAVPALQPSSGVPSSGAMQ